MIHESDMLKKLDEIFIPDIRTSFWQKSAEHLLATLHKDLNEIQLKDYVHPDVFREFEKTKNIVLYSFYSYSMSSVAIMHAYSCVEKAILLKAKKLDLITEDYKYKGKELLFAGSGLNRKINFAIDRKWIGKKHFVLFDTDEESIQNIHFEKRLQGWVDFRNSLSHDPAFLNILWQVPEHLKLFANMINAISKFNEKINSEIPDIDLPKRPIQVSSIVQIMMGKTDLLEFIPLRH